MRVSIVGCKLFWPKTTLDFQSSAPNSALFVINLIIRLNILKEQIFHIALLILSVKAFLHAARSPAMTQGKIDLRNESGRPMKVKVVGEVSEKWN